MRIAYGYSQVLVVGFLESVWQILRIPLIDVGPRYPAEHSVAIGKLMIDACMSLIIFARATG